MPRVFTEQGIMMLATILKSKIAAEVSMEIIDTFVAMRKYISNNKMVLDRLTMNEYNILKLDSRVDELFDKFESNEDIKERVLFEGQIYDAYSLYIKLIKSAKRRIVIIDNYLNNEVLDMLTKKDKEVDVLLVSDKKSKITFLDIDKFNKEYGGVTLRNSNLFHDRFMIIDNSLYVMGSSIKDSDKSITSINKIEDKNCLKEIIKRVGARNE